MKSASIDGWIRNMVDFESHIHDDTWIGEMICKKFKKNQNVRCFNCDKQGHLKRDCRQGVSRNFLFVLF